MKRSALALGVTSLSFVLGFLRDISIARAFGGSLVADAVFVALIVPTFIENILGVALRDAVVPHLHAAGNLGRDAFRAEASRMGHRLLMVGCGLALIFAAAPKFVLAVLVPGWSQQAIDQAAPLFVVGAASIVLVIWAYFQNALLNLRDSFVLPLWRTVLFNIGALLGIWLVAEPSAEALLVGMLIGLAVHTLWMQSILGGCGLRPARGVAFAAMPQGNLGAQFLPLFGATVALQVNVVAERFFASWLDAGTMAHLSYAYRLATVPLTLFSFSVLSIVYTRLVTRFGNGERDAWGQALTGGLALMMLVMVPAAVYLGIFARPLVSLLLGHGAFGAADVEATAHMLAAYGMGLPAMALALVAGRALLSLGRAREVLQAAVVCAVTTLFLDTVLMAPLGGLGLAVSVSLGAYVNAGWLVRSLSCHTQGLALGRSSLRWAGIGGAIAVPLLVWPWQGLVSLAGAGMLALGLAVVLGRGLDPEGWIALRNLHLKDQSS